MTEKNNYAIDCGIGIIAGCATKASLSKTSGSIAEKFIGGLHKRQGLWKQVY